MTLFRKRVSELEIEGLPPVLDEKGRPKSQTYQSESITVKAGDVTLTIALSKDKKSLEVIYLPKGKPHDHQTRSGVDGARLQVTL